MKKLNTYIQEKLVIDKDVRGKEKITISSKNLDNVLKEINEKMSWRHLHYKADDQGRVKINKYDFVLGKVDGKEHVYIRPEKDHDVTNPLKGKHFGYDNSSPTISLGNIKDMVDNNLGLFYIICGKMDIERCGTLYKFWLGPHGELFNDIDDAEKFLKEYKSTHKDLKFSFDIMTLEQSQLIVNYMKKKQGIFSSNNSSDKMIWYINFLDQI